MSKKKEQDLEIENGVDFDAEYEENEVKTEVENNLIKEIEVLKDKSLRLQADFDNFRKRNASIIAKTREDTTKDVLTDLLDVADNLDRAMEMIEDQNTRDGIQIVINQLEIIFKKYSVAEMKALGEEFDPNFHNAIMQEDNPDEAGKITMVFQKGYMIKDSVLRYATVKVAK